MFLVACIKLILAFIIGLYFSLSSTIEKNIVYKPSKELSPLILEADIKEFTNSENLKLSYLQIKGNKEKPIILFCHGNDGNITLKKLQEKMLFLEKEGIETFVLDYRGYGKSGGEPEEKGLYADVRSFIDYLNINPKNTIIWGHSLGAAVAVDIAKTLPFRGVILEGGFTSIEDMRDFRIKYDDKGNPVSNLIRDIIYKSLNITQNFNSKEKIGLIKSPMLIIHGKKDTVVPHEMGVKLSKLNPNAIFYSCDTGTHTGIGWQDSAVLEFIESLTDN